MHYQIKGILIIAVSTIWMIAHMTITDIDTQGNRVDLLGLPCPEEIFKHRHRSTGPFRNRYFIEQMKYLHFWIGFPVWFAGVAVGGWIYRGKDIDLL